MFAWRERLRARPRGGCSGVMQRRLPKIAVHGAGGRVAPGERRAGCSRSKISNCARAGCCCWSHARFCDGCASAGMGPRGDAAKPTKQPANAAWSVGRGQKGEARGSYESVAKECVRLHLCHHCAWDPHPPYAPLSRTRNRLYQYLAVFSRCDTTVLHLLPYS